MKAYTDLRIDIRDRVARITIDRPARLNSLRMTITDRSLIEALADLGQNPEVKAILLTGAGDKAFCTGWDLEAVGDTSLAELESLIRANLELFFAVWNQRQPVIAAINGFAIGTGSALALCCDMALAADTARLGEPEIRHGALSPFLILPFLTHAKAVHEIYYTGDLIGADELYRLGLVNRVVPLAELEDAAWAYAARIAKVPAYSLQMTKRSLRAAYDVIGLSLVVRQHGLADTLVIGADFPEQKALLEILVQQGMRAFLDARDGPFKE